MRVCSRHFHTGKAAFEMLGSDPDWVPSLHLGHNEGNTRQTKRFPPSMQLKKVQKQSQATETRAAEMTQGESQAAGDGCGAGAGRPMVRPWSKVKSLLQLVLQRKKQCH
ncbi:hypothetical protein EXN66_Car021710 [Channa argus]|uniref:THAP-type domain-containing protein n=1 Tax=Channa argus TaxID=215402 RepID=A0A6G1QUM7_CHAAH|nr:hypothetical protein EXN66_Car021710 [Channa argus]